MNVKHIRSPKLRKFLWDRIYKRQHIATNGCCICGAVALYMWRDKGYCEKHKQEAREHAKRDPSSMKIN